jgi:hypothetical protein
MVQFECISRYATSEEERKAISSRVANEIEKATSMYKKISDRLFGKTLSRFSKIVERIHEPPTNFFTWPGWRVLYYVYDYTFDYNKIEAKAIECKIYHPYDYEAKYGSRTDIIVKTTLDGSHFVWESPQSKRQALQEAEKIRMQKIKETHNDNYGNFVAYRKNFETSIEPYQKIFITKNTKTNL